MFFQKKDKWEFEKEMNLVQCVDCKFMLPKKDAQKIPVQMWSYLDSIISYRYYCPSHKKMYETVFRSHITNDESYYKEFKTDAKGNPIGYKKSKE